MADVVFLLVVAAFFAVCVVYVQGCERVVRGAEQPDGETTR